MYIGINAQNLKKWPRTYNSIYTITTRAPVGANKVRQQLSQEGAYAHPQDILIL